MRLRARSPLSARRRRLDLLPSALYSLLSKSSLRLHHGGRDRRGCGRGAESCSPSDFFRKQLVGLGYGPVESGLSTGERRRTRCRRLAPPLDGGAQRSGAGVLARKAAEKRARPRRSPLELLQTFTESLPAVAPAGGSLAIASCALSASPERRIESVAFCAPARSGERDREPRGPPDSGRSPPVRATRPQETGRAGAAVRRGSRERPRGRRECGKIRPERVERKCGHPALLRCVRSRIKMRQRDRGARLMALRFLGAGASVHPKRAPPLRSCK